jgi:hypothetical protein
MKCSEDEFAEHCLRPAVEFRQRIRDELHRMELEFETVQMGIEGFDVRPVMIESAPEEDPSEALEVETPDDNAGSLETRIARLESLLPAAGSEIRKAQELTESQPDAALLSARRGLELLIREVYKKLIGTDPGRMTLFDMLNELNNGGYIPEPVMQHLHSVRTLGNIAAHGDSSSVTSDDAQMAVLSALRTGDWASAQLPVRPST